MSRYLLLLLINAPFIGAALLSALTQYKMKRISARRYWAQTVMWVLILAGLILAEPIYTWLFSNNLTDTEPLSLFDVIQITAIVVIFYIANRTRSKLERVERIVKDMHQELSIYISEKK